MNPKQGIALILARIDFFSSSGYNEPEPRYHSDTRGQKALPRFGGSHDMSTSVSLAISDGFRPSIFCLALVLAVH